MEAEAFVQTPSDVEITNPKQWGEEEADVFGKSEAGLEIETHENAETHLGKAIIRT